ncbi:MAG: two-component sensor histidine kinase [Nocardioidaceae bacterium]|nr:two-component sensor histidine kinase [Nocardioidaceae bacterium]
MIAGAILVGLATVGVSLVVTGVLLLTRRTRLSGSLLVVSGTTVVISAVLDASEHPEVARFGFVMAAALVLPLALTAYPRADWRHPVDFVAVATITAAGALALAQWPDTNVVGTMGLVLALALIAHTWWRIERSSGSDRWALTWMALGAGVPGLGAGVAFFAAPTTTGAVVAFALFTLLGPAMYVGVARPEVVDVRGLVVHSVVFALAGVVYVAGFVALASLLEILNGTTPTVGVMAITGLLAAMTFHPLQVVLRGVVDELLFGHRPDPLGAATNVVASIGDDPELALRAIRAALVLPYSALGVDGVPLAVSGSKVTHTRTLNLELGNGQQGALVVGLRAGDLRLSPGDEHVLRLVGPLLAQTLRASSLAAELQQSREETITALEEERRRLRRDLHDGLGPRLSGIAFTSDAARNSLRSDPDTTDSLLVSLRAETVTAIEEIRRLVYAMRPPALDELGLVPALRQRAVALRTSDGGPLRVSIAAGELPVTVTAAVEVAAYRIVVEALTNVARHSGSDTAAVSLRADDGALVIDVVDVGTTSDAWTAGVGIASMRERAAELGGTLTAASSTDGGRVHAVLPLP